MNPLNNHRQSLILGIVLAVLLALGIGGVPWDWMMSQARPQAAWDFGRSAAALNYGGAWPILQTSHAPPKVQSEQELGRTAVEAP